MTDAEIISRLRDPSHANDLFLRRAAADRIERCVPKFDAHMPEQERLVLEFCMEIAGPKGQPACPPDPVRLLEMADALYRAEIDLRTSIELTRNPN